MCLSMAEISGQLCSAVDAIRLRSFTATGFPKIMNLETTAQRRSFTENSILRPLAASLQSGLGIS